MHQCCIKMLNLLWLVEACGRGHVQVAASPVAKSRFGPFERRAGHWTLV